MDGLNLYFYKELFHAFRTRYFIGIPGAASPRPESQ